MAEAREYIFELDKKLKFLIEAPVVREKCGHNASEASFCSFADIPRTTLRGGREKGKLSADDQRKIAFLCGFSCDWVEWLDPHAAFNTPADARRDTAEDFKRRYLEKNGAKASDAEAVTAPCPPRRTGLRLKAARPFAPEAADPMLASVELNVSQAGPDDPWLLSADLVCLPAPAGGVEIAVKRGRLEFDCAGAHTGELKDRTGYPSGYTIDEREGGDIILRPFGTSQRPGWDVQAKGQIGALPLPHDFCPVEEIAAGEVIEIRFSAYAKDLELTESEEDEDEPDGEDQPENESYSFVRPGKKKLGAAKEKILKRMAEIQLTGSDDGWSVLCRDARRFDPADEDGDT